MARDCRRRIRLVLVHGPSSCPGKEMTLPAAPDDNHPPAAASISASNRTTLRRASGCNVSMSMMSAQSSPRASR